MRYLVFLFMAAVLVMASPAWAKKITIGSGKGQEVQSNFDIQRELTEKTIASLEGIRATQQQTNELLKQMSDNLLKEQKARAVASGVPAAPSVVKETTNAANPSDVASSADILALVQQMRRQFEKTDETNTLLRQLIEETKWLTTAIEGTYKSSKAAPANTVPLR